MIISDNSQPQLSEFKKLMAGTDHILNDDASRRQDYYTKRGGKLIEHNVYDALNECAKGTAFQGTIQLVSGASFPDIVAKKYYGVEVKSTEKDHWTSIGSSILESTRNQDVKRIYLTFAKLGKPVQFISRPYEDCLSGIAVTHYPRYQIDMRLQKGETIFEKMGIPYDEIRLMDNPVVPVSKYYKGKLKPGESLWWAADDIEAAAPPTVRLWSTLSAEGKEELTVQGYTLFPEVLTKGNNKKYNRYALWLVTQKGVVNTNIRDGFSAGGKVLMKTAGGVEVKMPAAFGRIKKYHELIQDLLEDVDPEVLEEYWGTEIKENRIRQWCELVATAANSDSEVGYSTAWSVLSGIFVSIDKPTVTLGKRTDRPVCYYDEVENESLVADARAVHTNLYGKDIQLDDEKSLSLKIDVHVGDKVHYSDYGIGTVKGFKKDIIVVSFSGEDHFFQFPDSFLKNGFLKKL